MLERGVLVVSATLLTSTAGAAIMRATTDALELQAVPRQTTIRISLQFSITTSASSIDVQIDVEYRATSKRKHVLHSTVPLQLALPLGINVQDFFRPDRCVPALHASS